MTQEQKEVLLKDLCARLPYGVVVNYKENELDFRKWKITTLHAPSYSEKGNLLDTDYDGWISFEEYKGCGMSCGARPLHIEKNLPYLRPMSSMTDEERKIHNGHRLSKWSTYSEHMSETIDWLNAHHFDYRGLIVQGLAIEVTENNNPYKD